MCNCLCYFHVIVHLTQKIWPLTRRRSSGPALGSVRNRVDNGSPFDASEQQTDQHRGIINKPRAVGTSVGRCRISVVLRTARTASSMDCCLQSAAASRMACGLQSAARTMAPRSMRTPELTSRGPRTASRNAAAWTVRAARSRAAGRPWYLRGAQSCSSVCSVHKPPARCRQAESSDCSTWTKESRAHACHWSSHRVESLAVLFRPRAQASPLGADKHIRQLRHLRHGKEHSSFRSTLLLAPERSFWLRLQLSLSGVQCGFRNESAQQLFPVA